MIKLLNLLFLLSLSACTTTQANNYPPPPVQTPQETGRVFDNPRYKSIYEKFGYEANFTDSPKLNSAFNSVCYVLDQNQNLVGSGSLIRPGVVLTAAHVAEHVEGGYIRFDSLSPVVAIKQVWLHPIWELAKGDKKQGDLALLRLSRNVTDRTPLSMAASDLEIARYTWVFSVGCSLDYKKQSRPGVMFYYGTFTTSKSDLTLKSNTTTIWFGDSGGAIVTLNPEGQFVLVGVLSSFTNYQGIVQDFTAADLRHYSGGLDSIMDSWEKNIS